MRLVHTTSIEFFSSANSESCGIKAQRQQGNASNVIWGWGKRTAMKYKNVMQIMVKRIMAVWVSPKATSLWLCHLKILWFHSVHWKLAVLCCGWDLNILTYKVRGDEQVRNKVSIVAFCVPSRINKHLLCRSIFIFSTEFNDLIYIINYDQMIRGHEQIPCWISAERAWMSLYCLHSDSGPEYTSIVDHRERNNFQPRSFDLENSQQPLTLAKYPEEQDGIRSL